MSSLAKLLTPLSLAMLALTGCCCPEISGRYCHGPEPMPLPAPAANCQCGHAPGVGGCGLLTGHRPLLPWLHGGLAGAGANDPVPSQQHDDYLSPPPKFHPVPTRPVFEPQPAYSSPVLLDPSGKQ